MSSVVVLGLSLCLPTTGLAHPVDDPSEPSPVMATALPFVVTGAAVGSLALSASLSERDFSPTDVLGIAAVPFLFAGPSAGQIYAGNWLEAGLSTGGRVVGLGMLLVASGDCQSNDCDDNQWWAVAGLATIVGSTVYSVWDGTHAASEAQHDATEAQLTIMPMRGPSGSQGFGAGASWSL